MLTRNPETGSCALINGKRTCPRDSHQVTITAPDRQQQGTIDYVHLSEDQQEYWQARNAAERATEHGVRAIVLWVQPSQLDQIMRAPSFAKQSRTCLLFVPFRPSIDTSLLPGMLLVAERLDPHRFEDFSKRFSAEFADGADAFASVAYDSVLLLANAIDQSVGSPAAGTGLIDAIRKFRGPTRPPAITGDFRFRAGNATRNASYVFGALSRVDRSGLVLEIFNTHSRVTPPDRVSNSSRRVNSSPMSAAVLVSVGTFEMIAEGDSGNSVPRLVWADPNWDTNSLDWGNGSTSGWGGNGTGSSRDTELQVSNAPILSL